MAEYAVYPFPWGFLEIGYEGNVVVSLKKAEKPESGQEPGRAQARTALSDLVYGQITEYLEGRRRVFTFPYELRGTEFQKKVWRELCKIPYGEIRTYGEIAAAVGNPKAARAVGMANNKNPIFIAVPCHRVIGADGKLVGYAGGLDMKRDLLRLERAGGISEDIWGDLEEGRRKPTKNKLAISRKL